MVVDHCTISLLKTEVGKASDVCVFAAVVDAYGGHISEVTE